MADGKVTIDIGLNDKEFKQNLGRISQEARTGFGDVSKAATDSFNEINNAAKKSASQYKSDVMKLAAEYRKAGMDKSAALRKANQDIDKSEYDFVQKSEKRSKKFAHNWKDAGEKLSAWTIAKGQLIAGAIKQVAQSALNVGKQVINIGANFEQGMAEVQAIAGATSEDLEKLTDKAKEMGKTTKFSATESAEALKYMAMAGWDTKAMLGGISGVMDLAAASGEDLATVSDIVTDSMTAFGLKADEAGHFADVLAQASSKSNTNVAMMGETFKYIAPLAGALGYNIEDTSVAIGLMANAGIKASQAGTTLRGALTRMAKPTKDVIEGLTALGLAGMETNTVMGDSSKAQEKLEKAMVSAEKAQNRYNESLAKHGSESATTKNALLSLEEAQKKVMSAQKGLADAQTVTTVKSYAYNAAITDSDGNMLTLKETLDKVRFAFKDLSEAEKAQYAAQLFGQEAMSGMLAIINASDEDYEKLTEQIYNSEGAAKDMANTMNDTLHGAILESQSALEALALTMYEKIQGGAKNAVKAFAKEMRNLDDVIKEGTTEEIIAAITELLLRALQTGIEFLPQVVDYASLILSTLANSLISNLPVLSDSILQILDSMAQMFTDNFYLFNDVAFNLLIAFAEFIVAAIPKLVTAAQELMKNLAKFVVDNIPKLLETAPKIVENLVKTLVQNAPKLIKSALEMILQIVKGIIQNLPKIIKAGSDILKNLIKGIGNIIPELLATAKELVRTIVDTIVDTDWWELGKSIISSLIEGIVSMAGALWDAFTGIFRGIGDFISGLLAPDGYDVSYNGDDSSNYGYSGRGRSGEPGPSTYSSNVNVYMNYNGTPGSPDEARHISRAIGRETQKEMRMRGITPAYGG